MSRRGPSPLVPALMIGVLSMVVFWPYILILVSYLIPLFQGGEEEAGVVSSFVMLLLPVSLLLLAGAGFSNNRNWQRPSSSPGSDGEGFGIGTVILLVLYFVLYSYM